jgi:cyclin D5, plant
MMSNKCGRCWCLAGHVYSCYSAMIREDDKSPTQSTSTSTGVASSGVSVAAHAGGSGSPSLGASVSVGANNAAGTAPPATTDNRNKRRQLRSPQRQ